MAKQTKNAGAAQADEFEFGAPEGFDQGMGNPLSGSGIELPFFTPFLSWFNGNTAYKKHPVLATYTGGWSMWQEAADALEADPSLLHVNNAFELAEGMSNKDGEEYSAYLAQWLPCAILGERTRWLDKGNGKKSSHTQVLVYTADPMFDGKGKLEMLGAYAPMVLTVKGWQSDYLKKAIKTWISQTTRARAEAGKGKALHPSLFYILLGVAGKERQTQQVGSVDEKAITPVQALLPDLDAGAAALRMYYVGREAAGIMLELKEQAKEWLGDAKWKSGQTDDARSGNGGPNEPEAPPPAGEEEFPF